MSNHEPGFKSEWYALYVRHQNEYKICQALQDMLGIESLVPSRKVWKKSSGKVKVFKKPLLGAYVFIKANLRAVNWKLCYSVNGIIDFVRSCGAPASIPDEQIESIQKLCDSGVVLHEMEHTRIKDNDRVEVVGGPLKGAIGSFLKTNRKSGNFIVSLDLFERSLITEVDPALLKAF